MPNIKKTETTNAPKAKRGRPVNESRRNDILHVAGELFMRDGFQSTTMDRIASEAGVSKLTLYNRFSNKDDVFAAVIVDKCNQYIPRQLFDDFRYAEPREALYHIGCGYIYLLTSPDAMNVERMLMAEAKNKAKLTKIFFDAGPRAMHEEMAAHMKRLSDTKIIGAIDPAIASHLFMALFKGSDICFRMRMNIPPKPTKAEIEHYCRHAVDLFLAANKP